MFKSNCKVADIIEIGLITESVNHLSWDDHSFQNGNVVPFSLLHCQQKQVLLQELRACCHDPPTTLSQKHLGRGAGHEILISQISAGLLG